MNILNSPLSALSANDIHQLCVDGVSEGLTLELKSDLPTRLGKSDEWHGGGSFGEFARNQIAEEIIAFANTIGGVVLIGVYETSDHPHRAEKLHPLPRVHELARRLRQAVQDIVDPPLPLLEAEGVEMAEGSGVVVMRVSASRRRPHRHQVNKEVFIRRADESVRVGMREIQELTLRSVGEAVRIDTAIERRRRSFQQDLSDWARTVDSMKRPRLPANGVHLVGIPTTTFDLGRVAGRPELLSAGPGLKARFGAAVHSCNWPWARSLTWKPALRSLIARNESTRLEASYLRQTDGLCELRFYCANTETRKGLYASWLAGGLAYMLDWIERIRRGSGNVGTEFALAPVVGVVSSPAVLVEYGVDNFVEAYGTTLAVGFHEFPILSIGGFDEFSSHWHDLMRTFGILPVSIFNEHP
jgi:schlafen family protein